MPLLLPIPAYSVECRVLKSAQLTRLEGQIIDGGLTRNRRVRPPKEQPILVKQVIRAWTSSEGAKSIPVEYSLRASIDKRNLDVDHRRVFEQRPTESRGMSSDKESCTGVNRIQTNSVCGLISYRGHHGDENVFFDVERAGVYR